MPADAPRPGGRTPFTEEMILPAPSESFEWVHCAGGPALVCRPLAALAPHMFTTQHWTLGASATGVDDAEAWGEVAKAMHVGPADLVRVRQVHGATVARASDARLRRPDADIVTSVDPALAAAIQVADCVPLLLVDRRSGSVAAAHAGWRGLAAQVPALAVESLAREFATRPADVVAAVGPAIGPCCYEVGSEVRERFQAAAFHDDQIARWFGAAPVASPKNPSLPAVAGSRRGDRWFFDAWAAAREQLLGSGVPAEQIFIAELCTASHPRALCSYRRDGAPAGRMAAAIRSAPLRP